MSTSLFRPGCRGRTPTTATHLGDTRKDGGVDTSPSGHFSLNVSFTKINYLSFLYPHNNGGSKENLGTEIRITVKVTWKGGFTGEREKCLDIRVASGAGGRGCSEKRFARYFRLLRVKIQKTN